MTNDKGQAVIRTARLCKDYNGFSAVKDVTLQVEPNEIYGFLGPNGAGKTTTIMMLLGIEKPTSGQVFLFGQSLPENYFEIKRRIGVLAEHQYFYDDMTAREYLSFFADLYRLENKEDRIESLLEVVDLRQFGDVRALDYSRGMQQKLGIIRALLHDPELLILDEPVSALDPFGTLEIRHLLQEQVKHGKTVFISSHILSEVEQTADRIGIMNRGELVAEDSLDNLRHKLRQQIDLELVLEEILPGLVERLSPLEFVREITSNGNKLSLKLDATADFRPQIFAAISNHGGIIVDMRTKEMSLEEAFVTITEQNVSLLAKTEVDK
jgi:ABC-2 type transport system ATP-binding protein